MSISIDMRALEDLKQISAFLEFIKDPAKYEVIAKQAVQTLSDIQAAMGVYNTLEKVKRFEAGEATKRLQADKALTERETKLQGDLERFTRGKEAQDAQTAKQMMESSNTRKELLETRRMLDTKSKELADLSILLQVRSDELTKKEQTLKTQETKLAEKAAKVKEILG